MAIALVVADCQGLGANGGTTGTSLDTTGATLLVVAIHDYDVSTLGTVSDSKSNTWTALTAYYDALGGTARTRLYYAVDPTVGSGHTFTYTGTDVFASCSIAAYSGVATTSPFDTGKDSGAGNNDSTTIAPGSLTPSEDNCLVVTGLTKNSADTATINGSFTIHDQISQSGGNWFGGGIASLIQTTAAAANPTWTLSTSQTLAAGMAVFKAGAGVDVGTGGPFPARYFADEYFARRYFPGSYSENDVWVPKIWIM